MLAITHAFLAFGTSDILESPTNVAILASLIPDVDIFLNYVTPLVRNGLTHSILFGLICMALMQVVFADRNFAEAFLIGYSSHLFLDLLTFNGIMIFFPLGSFLTLGIFPEYGAVSNLAVLSLTAVATIEIRTETVREIAETLFSSTSVG